MHILFNDLFQEVNTSRNRGIQPQEIDLRINVATLDWVQSQLPPLARKDKGEASFEDTGKLYDSIKELKKHKLLSTMIDSESYGTNLRTKSLLPANYMHCINSRSLSYYNCNGITFGSPVIAATTKLIRYVAIPFTNDSVPPSGGYFDKMQLEVTLSTGTVLIYDLSDVTKGGAYLMGILKSNTAKFEVVNAALDYVNKTKTYSTGVGVSVDVELYWEYFGDVYAADSFICVVSNLVGATATSFSVTTRVDATPAIIKTTTNFADYTYTYYTPTNGVSDEYKNRLISSDIVHEELRNPFGKTIYSSPVSIIEGRYIKVYYNSTFYPTQIMMDYIKIPRLVDIDANISSEINPNFHAEIVKLAVLSALADVNAKSYQAKLQEVVTLK